MVLEDNVVISFDFFCQNGAQWSLGGLNLVVANVACKGEVANTLWPSILCEVKICMPEDLGWKDLRL